MWHSYIFSVPKDRLNVIVLHSKQQHTLARGTSPTESYLLNFSKVKQIALGSQISFTVVSGFRIDANLLLWSNRSSQGQTAGNFGVISSRTWLVILSFGLKPPSDIYTRWHSQNVESR